MVKLLGYSPGEWFSIMLVVFAALVLFQLSADALRKFGGSTGAYVANRATGLAGLNNS